MDRALNTPLPADHKEPTTIFQLQFSNYTDFKVWLMYKQIGINVFNGDYFE